MEERAERDRAIGGLLQNKVLICGGENEKEYALQDCFVIGQPNNSFQMLEKRKSAASIVLNQNKILWVTGGNGGVKDKESTELISLDQQQQPLVVQGPVLPFKIKSHSMVETSPNCIYIIGGIQNGLISDKTWIVDQSKNFEITPGPPLKREREGHCCSKMKIDGRMFLVVACGNSHWIDDRGEVTGGVNFKSVQLLNLDANNPQWQKGK